MKPLLKTNVWPGPPGGLSLLNEKANPRILKSENAAAFAGFPSGLPFWACQSFEQHQYTPKQSELADVAPTCARENFLLYEGDKMGRYSNQCLNAAGQLSNTLNCSVVPPTSAGVSTRNQWPSPVTVK